MDPNEIKAELTRRGLRQSELAKRLGVTRGMVWLVIHGQSQSEWIRQAIARAIRRPVHAVWRDKPAA